ncbi:unnamed protein product [Musa acuminata subsp. malaccensis]|uniref:(wild Malaysian banana) hypothetical protein n=1 Tax=Musa acuminata subsp. malaccensis TaxID=214687 RepID=A0A804IY68_MUSAM|nr:unnamed protein product [Musa acuminata subsp. malaccensis]
MGFLVYFCGILCQRVMMMSQAVNLAKGVSSINYHGCTLR